MKEASNKLFYTSLTNLTVKPVYVLTLMIVAHMAYSPAHSIAADGFYWNSKQKQYSMCTTDRLYDSKPR